VAGFASAKGFCEHEVRSCGHEKAFFVDEVRRCVDEKRFFVDEIRRCVDAKAFCGDEVRHGVDAKGFFVDEVRRGVDETARFLAADQKVEFGNGTALDSVFPTSGQGDRRARGFCAARALANLMLLEKCLSNHTRQCRG
jgi:hypothetical protein